MHSPRVPMTMGYGGNAGVKPQTATTSPAPSPVSSSFMPVPPAPAMPSVFQQSGKQRRFSSNHQYTPIAPAPPSHSTKTTALSPVVTSSSPSAGYYNQHSTCNVQTQPQTPTFRPASQYLLPTSPPSHPVPSNATSSTTMTAPSCILAKLDRPDGDYQPTQRANNENRPAIRSSDVNDSYRSPTHANARGSVNGSQQYQLEICERISNSMPKFLGSLSGLNNAVLGGKAHFQIKLHPESNPDIAIEWHLNDRKITHVITESIIIYLFG